MKFFSPLRLRVEKDVTARIHRILKGTGTINAVIGQEVTPSDIIGLSSISSGFRTINMAQLLSVAPYEVAKYMKKSLGQRIYKGELLASTSGGLLGGKKIVTSPTDGVLDFLNPETGGLRLTFFPKKQELPAGVYGIVDSIDHERGRVIIRAQVSVVHGMFGTGMARDGILHVVGKRDELIGKSLISETSDGQILAGGSLVFRGAITSAISNGISGIITGGMNAKDYKGMAGGRLTFPKKLPTDIGISIIICEGFGSIPMGEDIYDILRKFDNKFVSIDGNAGVVYLPNSDSNSIIKVRSTALLPPEDNGRITTVEPMHQIAEVTVGLHVRVIGNSYSGEQGNIVAINKTETVMPSGIKAFMATIETRRRKVEIPVENLEVIGYSH